MSIAETMSSHAANVGATERTLSTLGGGALALYVLLRRSPLSLLLAPLAAGLVYRGVRGHCPLYGALGVDTSGREEEAFDDATRIDQASEDSFPASDAPAWTPTTSVGR